ncbi:unnamed protein product [Caenorhabditis angaria]|uniref:Uncharacterized protein n=1 Tax=Caenorhabditis angaria TaxID=860376 RepID=A0A9P1MXP4_9PELO|nr:unnamed protein product [Caenorhabditis angaria]
MRNEEQNEGGNDPIADADNGQLVDTYDENEDGPGKNYGTSLSYCPTMPGNRANGIEEPIAQWIGGSGSTGELNVQPKVVEVAGELIDLDATATSHSQNRDGPRSSTEYETADDRSFTQRTGSSEYFDAESTIQPNEAEAMEIWNGVGIGRVGTEPTENQAEIEPDIYDYIEVDDEDRTIGGSKIRDCSTISQGEPDETPMEIDIIGSNYENDTVGAEVDIDYTPSVIACIHVT